MDQEILVKMTRWVFYGAVGVLAIAVFFVFFGERGDRDMTRTKNMLRNTLGMEEGISSRVEGPTGKKMGSVAPDAPIMEPRVLMDEGASSQDSFEMAVAPDSSTAFESRVIRNGNLSIRVEDAEWTADEIDRVVTRLGGFTSSRMMNGQEAYPMPLMRGNGEYDAASRKTNSVSGNTIQSGTVTVKVPSSKFAEAVSSIKGIATVVINESSSASDVTMQFADLEAQIRNKRTEEEAFTKILNTNTGKVSDILEVTRELARVRGEIEQLETQKKYMESETDMAELSISLTEDAKVGTTTDAWRPWQTVKMAMNQLLLKFQGFVDGVIYFIVSVLPFFLLYLLGLYIVYRVGRNVYRKMRGQE